MEGETWLLDGDAYLFIESGVIAGLARYQQLAGQSEAGGCLYGYYRGDHIHVSHCTEPMPGDRRQPFQFNRKDPHHLAVGKKLHAHTQETCTYLGDWHTHPQEIPTPSSLDFSEWDKISRIKGKWPSVVLIVGINSLWVGVGDSKNKIRTPLQSYR